MVRMLPVAALLIMYSPLDHVCVHWFAQQALVTGNVLKTIGLFRLEANKEKPVPLLVIAKGVDVLDVPLESCSVDVVSSTAPPSSTLFSAGRASRLVPGE